jgi:hypothetical protein
MPRLYFYAAIGGTITSALWAFDKYYYTPSLTTKREMELFVEAEKSALINVYQAFSLLRDIVPFRNTERIALFCKIQMIRQEAFALPPNLLSAIDKSALLRTLDELQREHCISLRCRDVPLTSEESWKCTLAFGIFLIAFRFVLPLLVAFRCCADAALVREAVKAGTYILNIIDVDADMTVDEEASKLITQSVENAPAELLWHPSSWVEEAAFWASPSNPWTRGLDSQSSCSSSGGNSQALRQVAQFLVQQQQQPHVEHFEHRFQREYQSLVDVANTALTSSSVKFNAETPGTLFGYPSSLREVEIQNYHRNINPFYVPVVAVGIEKLTYLGETFASRDVRAPKTGTDRYKDVYELQYGAGNLLKNPQGAAHAVTSTESQKEVPAPFAELPLFSKESITCIFGGRPAGSGRRRTLFLHVGAPVVRAEAWKAYVGSYAELANRAAVVGV